MIVERAYPRVFAEVDELHQARYHLALRYIQPGHRILDAACGAGYGSHYMAANSMCESVVGIDVSPEALQWAEEYFRSDKITFVQGDLTTAFAERLPHRQYDLITSFETLEHLADDRGFLTQLRQLLKPGGYLLLSCPNEDLVPWREANNPYHFRHYRTAELTQLLQEQGFHVVDHYSQTWMAPLFRGHGGEVNIVVCRSDQANVIPFTDFDSIIGTCQVLKSTRNDISDLLPYMAIHARFQELLGAYIQFARAVDLVAQGNYEAARAAASQVNPTLCPEREFVLGMASEGLGDRTGAAGHYVRVIQLEDKVTGELLAQAQRRLESVRPQQRAPLRVDGWNTVAAERFLDPGDASKLDELLACTVADVILAPVVYPVFEGHRMARWEPIAWRDRPDPDRVERVRLYVRGEDPDFWYSEGYQAFIAENFAEALAHFTDLYGKTDDPLDQAVLIRWIALCMIELGRDAEAIQLLTDAVELFPDYTDLRYILCRAAQLAGVTDGLAEMAAPALQAGDSTGYPEFFFDIRGLLLRQSE